MTAAFRRYLRSLLTTLGFARPAKRQPLRKEAPRCRTRLGIDFLEDRLAPAIFNVATFGNDLTGDGSAANPYRTMQRAINQAAAFADGNDTINLAGGTYNQAGVDLNSTVPNSPNITNLSILGGWNNTFTVRDPLLTPTTWAPQTAALATVDLLVQDANVTIDGFQFQFAAAGLSVQNANNVRVQNNSFLRVGPANAGGNSLLSALANASNVADFVSLNNTLDAGLGIAASSGIDLLGTGGFQITNAVITNTSVTNASGSGLRITNATTPTITGGSFSGNFIGVVLLDAANAFLTSTAINNNSSDGLLVSNILAVDLNLSNLTLTGNGSGATLTNVNGLNYVSSLGTVNDVLAVTPSQIILNRAGSLQQAINLVTLNFVKLDLGDGNDEAIFDTAVYPFAILEVNAQGGTDTLTYNATAGNDAIIVNNTTFTINGNTPPIQGPLVILQGFEEYSVNGLGGDDNFFVQATNAPVTLRGGLDNDTFFLGNAGTLDNLLVNLTLDGGAGSNGVELNDSAEAAGNSYTATTGSVVRNGGFTVTYTNLATVAIAGGSAPDTFNVTPDAVVTYTIVGNNPTLPTLPGDVLNLNLAGITNPTNFITGPGDGIFNFGNANPVGYQNIETVNTAGTPFDLVFNLNFSIFGNDGVADILRASLSASGTNFILERLGDPPFYTGQLYNGDVTLVRSFSVIGSFDDDTLIVQETAGGLLGQTGGFFGNAVGSHLNAPMQFFLNQLGQPTNVGLHFDGGLGGSNRLQYELLTQRDAQFFADAVAAARSGNVNIGATGGASASQLRSSFANLAPIGFLGAGGTLTVDNTGISGVGDVLTVEDDAVAGDGISQVTSSNPLFETTFFEGFNDLQVFGGSGGQTLIMNGLDSAATEVLVLLNGDDTFGSDVGDDQFFIRQSAAAVLTQAVGGGGNDTFNVGNVAGVVDNILGDVELFGDGGTLDVVIYDDAGTVVGQTYTIESDRINRSGGVGEVRYTTMEELNVFTSSGTDVIDILSTLATTPLFVRAGFGNDFINISSDAPLNSGNLDGIAGTVNIEAGAGTNTLSVSDLTGTTPNSNAFIGFNQILGFAGPADGTTINYTATGGSFIAINIEGSVNVGDTFTVNNPNGPLNLNTYGGTDTVNVQAISFVANINTGVAADTINVSSDAPANLGNLDAINATLNLEAGTGANVLNVSDFSSATANASALVTVNQITGLAGPTDNQAINYLATGGSFSLIRIDGSNLSGDGFTVQSPNGPLQLNTHGGVDTVNVQSIGFAASVNTGANTDIINVASDAPANLGNLDGINGTLNVDAGTGANILNVSDFGGATANANVVIGFSSITGFAGPADNQTINYTATGGSFSALNIQGSDTVGEGFTVANPNGPLNLFTNGGADTVNVQAISFVANINTGAGADTINVSSDAPVIAGDLAGINATLNLDAGTGVNVLFVSDFGGVTPNANAVIGFSAITGFAGAGDNQTINYAATGGSFSVIFVRGSDTVGDTFTVINPNGPLNLFTNGGADTVNVQAISLVANIDTGADADTINVSSDAPANLGNLDAINATLNLEAGFGANVLNVSDFGSATANANAIITVNQITGLAGPTDNQTINYLATGGSFSQIRVDGSNTSSDVFFVINPNGPLTLNTHGGFDDVFIEATTFATNVNGGADDDEFILRQGNVLDFLLGLITLDGGTGSNFAYALDSAQVIGRTYGLIAGQFTRDGGIQVNFANLVQFQINAGTGSDIFNVGTSTETIFILNGNLPAFPTLPGDTLNLDLTGATNPQLNLGDVGSGQFTFGNRQTIFYTSIETLNPTNGQIDLVVDMNQIPAWGNNGIADIIEIRLDAAGTNLLLDRLGAPPDYVGIFFNATVTAIRSVAIIGSNDNDTLRVREVNGRLPGETGGLNGNAVGSHLNAPMNFFLTQAGQPTNLGLNFNGGGGGQNRLQFVFTTSRNSRFFADTMAAPRSGNVNVSGTGGTPASALRVSFESLAPIDFFGAGGTLTVDNTGISGLFDQLVVRDDAVAGDGISQVTSNNPAFETTNFSGFDAVAVLGGTGDQTLVMDGLDSAATETGVLLDGDDTFGTDIGSDTFFVYQSAAAVTTTLLGGAGNDLFFIGDPTLVVDNILGDVDADGETGNDLLRYRDNGNAVGHIYTIENDAINRDGGVGEVRYVNQDFIEVFTSQGADRIDVLSTLAGAATRIFAQAGNDVINVSSDAPANLGNLDGIAGELSINGGGDANVLNISDFGGTTPNANVVIGFSTITGFAGPTDATTINYTGGGGTFSAINIEGSNTVGDTFSVQNPNGPLNLNTNGGADFVFVQATLFVANINAGADNDQIYVSSDAPVNLGNLDSIGATLNLEAGSGDNQIHVSDVSTTTANADVIINSSQFLNFAGNADNQVINYVASGGLLALTVRGSDNPLVPEQYTLISPGGGLVLFMNDGNDTVNLRSSIFQVQLLGGLGDDTYNFSSDAPANLGNLDSINFMVFVTEDGGANNRIRISDRTTATANSNVRIQSAVILGLFGAADNIDFVYSVFNPGTAFSELTIDGSNDPLTSEDYRVQSPNAPLTLNLNAGNDIARVQSIFQAAEINGGDEDDLLIASSTGNTFNGHLNDINATLTLNGDGGQNEMHIVDFDGGTNPNIGFTNSLIGGIAGATNNQTISYSNGAGLGDTLLLILQGSNAAIDNLNIFSTLANSTNNFFLNGGDDGFVVLSSAASSPGIANLFGGDGNDEFAFANGAALNTGFIDGGTGINLLNYVTWTTAVSVNLGTGLATGLLNNGVFEGNRIAPLTIQNIVGGSAGDLLLGDIQANRIEGRNGNNQIAGQGGDDILLGGTGNDVIMGGPGNDMLYGGGGRDAYFGDYVRPGSPVPPIPGAINNGPPGYNVIVLTSCNELRQGRNRGAIVIDPGGGPGVRGRIVVARFRQGQLIGPVFVRVGPVTLGPLVPMIQPRYTGQAILPPVLVP